MNSSTSHVTGQTLTLFIHQLKYSLNLLWFENSSVLLGSEYYNEKDRVREFCVKSEFAIH